MDVNGDVAGVLFYGDSPRLTMLSNVFDSPHVMKLYDVFETSQHIFLVLERVRGGELFDYILQKGRLPRHEALRLAAQIIQGFIETS